MKRHYVCISHLKFHSSVRVTPIFLLLCLVFLGPIAGFTQNSLSKKEVKAQELAANASRFFIEGEKALVLGDLE